MHYSYHEKNPRELSQMCVLDARNWRRSCEESRFAPLRTTPASYVTLLLPELTLPPCSTSSMASTEQIPKYDPTKPRYDPSTYWGRVLNSYRNTDLRTLLVSQERLGDAQTLLAQYEQGTLPPAATDEDLWEARRITDAILHPDTKEPVPLLFRFSAFGE